MKPIGLNLRVTGHCNQGGRKYMEDAFVVGYQQSENLKELMYAYFGVFDGHGGREAALFAKEHLMKNIVSQKGFWSNDDNRVLKAIRDGFLTTHHAMWKEVGNWPKTVSGLPSTSGTTSSIAFIRKEKLYTGHVGDSKIVLGCQSPDSDEWYAQPLTKDHKPGSPDEKKRIDSVGGLVLKKAGVQRVVWNRPRSDHKGPIRRSTEVEQIPFLAVSRSLGDLWSFNYKTNEFVVSPEPDVGVFYLNPRIHRCILFGSDGLWNMISAQSAVKIVQKAEEENEKIILEGGRSYDAEKLNNPSKLLVDRALRYWYDLGMRADNISVVTVMVDPPGPCKREVLLKQRVMKRLRPRDEQSTSEEEALKSSLIKDSSTPVTKDRKRPLDCIESAKERKMTEPPSKERKLSTDVDELAVPKNLPKPVILSPVRVHKSKSKSPETSNSTNPANVNPHSSNTNDCSSPLTNAATSTDSNSKSEEKLDAKVKKKELDSSNCESSTSKQTENENKFAVPVTSSHIMPETCEKSGEPSKSNVLENPGEKSISVGGENNLITKTDKNNDSSYPNNVSSKENGRVHLCEVDNFFKLNNRTSDSSEVKNVKARDLHNSDNLISSKEKKLKKNLPSRRRTIHKKSRNSTRRPQLQRNITSCRTRAQSNIQKFKV